MADETFHPSPRRWLLLAGVSLSIFLEVGVLKCYGVFLDDITRDLQTSTGLVGLITGMAQGLLYILAPVNRLLLKYFSTRQLLITGAIIGSVSYMMASSSRSFSQFAVALTISGLGYNMVVYPAHALPVTSFPDKFEIVSSIIMTSGGLGMMVLPVIAEQLSIIYGWRGGMLLLGALGLHNIPLGALIKPMGRRSAYNTGAQEQPLNKDDLAGSCLSPDETESLLESSSRGTGNMQLSESMSHTLNGNVGKVSPKEMPNTETPTESHLTADVRDSLLPSSSSRKADGNVQPPGSVRGLENNNRICTSSITLDPEKGVSSRGTFPADQDSFPENLWNSLKIMIGIDLVQRNRTILSIIIAMFWLGFSYSGWIVFVVPNAVAKGYRLETSVMLATVGGAANIFGRFIIGFISKSKILANDKIFLILSFLSALAYAMNNFSSSFWTLCLLAILNGSTLGAMTAMITVLSRDTAPDGDVGGVLSLLLMALGVGIPLGGFLVGCIFDQFKSYDHAFAFLGLTNLLSATSMLTPKSYRYVAQMMAGRKAL